jgi:hypothetical protein
VSPVQTIVLCLLPSLERNSFRVSDQAYGQEPTEKRIECQAKTRPPVRHTGVVDKEAMDEVENAVPKKGSDCTSMMFAIRSSKR